MGDSTTKIIFRSSTPLPRELPPASPHQPGLHAPSHHMEGENQPDANDFKVGIEGPDPNLAVGGSYEDQAYQAARTTQLGGFANLPKNESLFSDQAINHLLDGLKPNPPEGRDGVDVTHVVYQSHIPGSTAALGYDHFVSQPNEVFAAANLKIMPHTGKLADGAKYMLELDGTPKAWLPIQIHLDEAKHSIMVDTLDGHALRGHQTFTFTNDGKGGCVLTQDAHYQVSSPMIGALQHFESVANAQHDGWVLAHREIYNRCHGLFQDHPVHLDHPHHPGHEMFRQAHDGVSQLNAQHGVAASDRDRDFAAFASMSAKANGLDRIDHMLLSADGHQVFVVQGDLNSNYKQVAQMTTADALNTPISQSSATWERAVQQGQQAQQPSSGQNVAPMDAQRSGPVV